MSDWSKWHRRTVYNLWLWLEIVRLVRSHVRGRASHECHWGTQVSFCQRPQKITWDISEAYDSTHSLDSGQYLHLECESQKTLTGTVAQQFRTLWSADLCRCFPTQCNEQTCKEQDMFYSQYLTFDSPSRHRVTICVNCCRTLLAWDRHCVELWSASCCRSSLLLKACSMVPAPDSLGQLIHATSCLYCCSPWKTAAFLGCSWNQTPFHRQTMFL